MQGLDTLDFDANYKSTEISVCLVSSGAEVFMIKKEVRFTGTAKELLS